MHQTVLPTTVKVRELRWSSYRPEDEYSKERDGLDKDPVRVKNQSSNTDRDWAMEVLNVPAMADTLAEAVVRKALDISMSMSVIRSSTKLEFLVPNGAHRRIGLSFLEGVYSHSIGCFSDVSSAHIR